MRFKGKPVIGLGVVDGAGRQRADAGQGARQGDGRRREATCRSASPCTASPTSPRSSTSRSSEFISSLLEALAIVLVVSFISLGLRTGLVVALSVPLVLAITFVGMLLLGIDLQRISLGALIIALGLLVDDAIIAVEMMVVKLEQGCEPPRGRDLRLHLDRLPDADRHAGHRRRLPAGRLRARRAPANTPARSSGWSACRWSISWFVAVLFTPWLGYQLLPTPKVACITIPMAAALYTAFRKLVVWCVTWRKTTIAITALAFVAVDGRRSRLVPKQFFPTANRPELIVDLELAQGASLGRHRRARCRSSRSGWARTTTSPSTRPTSAPARRASTCRPCPSCSNANFAQVIVMTKDLDARERVVAELEPAVRRRLRGVRARVQRLQNGPPVGYPVQFRVLGRRSAAGPRRRRAGRAQVFKADPAHAQRQLRLERARQDRCGSRSTRTRRARSASTRSFCGNTLQTLAVGRDRDAVPRAHRDDRRGGPRRARPSG